MATKNRFNLPNNFKKLIPIFDKLIEDFPYGSKLENSTVICYSDKSILIITKNNKNLILLNEYNNCSMTGVIANRFNQNIWRLLNTLEQAYPKLINEISLLRQWITKEDAKLKRIIKIDNLMKEAKELGLKVCED